MTYKARIEQKLSVLHPVRLEVIDDSEKHRGHGGYREGGETHFTVRIVSPEFAGLSRVARHRLVNQLLAAELAERVHALALETRAPGEA
jgi:BolA protein